jgi:nucleoside-diphosphate-sugar epimerase
VCLRFFTVYGPRQRPDLAIHKFARLMSKGRAIPMYGEGSTERDYPYIDEILKGIEGTMELTGGRDSIFGIVNLGESTTSLRRLIDLIAEALGVTPEIQRLPLQPGWRHSGVGGHLPRQRAAGLRADHPGGAGDPPIHRLIPRRLPAADSR